MPFCFVTGVHATKPHRYSKDLKYVIYHASTPV
jgi:hypothetical protein